MGEPMSIKQIEDNIKNGYLALPATDEDNYILMDRTRPKLCPDCISKIFDPKNTIIKRCEYDDNLSYHSKLISGFNYDYEL